MRFRARKTVLGAHPREVVVPNLGLYAYGNRTLPPFEEIMQSFILMQCT